MVWAEVWVLTSLLLHQAFGQPQCPFPVVPINCKVSVGTRHPGEQATYTCDPGYTLFGSSSITCGANGKWSGDLPVCATNVAYKRPANQSSTARGGPASNANDGVVTTIHDGSKCTETLVQESPWWMVDLLRPYTVQVVSITTRGCCGQQPLQNVEVRVGDSTDIQKNRLCAWNPSSLEEGVTKEMKCALPLTGQFVGIQTVGSTAASLSLCEVQVFTTEEFSRERCSATTDLLALGVFNQTCYEFQVSKGGDFEVARNHCRGGEGAAPGGDLAHGMSEVTHGYLTSELIRRKDGLKAELVWIGARREKEFISRTWRWVDGSVVAAPRWGRDQPNNYNGRQDCVALDGGRRWRWNDVGCDLNYLPWICQYSPRSCGSPDVTLNATLEAFDTATGSEVTYRCPIGSALIGQVTRTCLPTGFWNGTAPTCRYVDCGPLEPIENGSIELVDQRTSFGATAVITCATNFTLEGDAKMKCVENGSWTPPHSSHKCLYSWCDDLKPLTHGKVSSKGQRAGDIASFTCDPGYLLRGAQTISCELGGKWSSEQPTCIFVDCRLPEEVPHGKVTLLSGSTHLGSQVAYTCEENYWLDGPKKRACMEDGAWSDHSPECLLITCPEPVVPDDGYITGYSFDIGSQIDYHCEAGFRVDGDSVRVCTDAGLWSGDQPACVYVDCGHVTTLPRGVVAYLNETTHLGALIEYQCSANHRLVGTGVRTCQVDGMWSGDPPQCQEIRCSPPEVKDKSKVLSITGNDRRIQVTMLRTREQQYVPPENSYRVGSTATYRCQRGYVANGPSLRRCLANGSWSLEAPTCVYVDCGLPEVINPGTFRLLSNTTHFGSQVSYECGLNWKLEGRIRRHCLANGTWAGDTPHCKEVLCPDLSATLRDSLTVAQGDRRVGTVAVYSCGRGRQLVGEGARECRMHGIWNGTQPRCEWVSCQMPADVPNGRVIRLNESLIYGAVVEYHCLPKYILQGTFQRTCGAHGAWTDVEPRCEVDDGSGSTILQDNNIDGTSNSALGRSGDGSTNDTASNTGLYVGLGFGLAGVVAFVVLLLLLRARQRVGSKEVAGGERPGLPPPNKLQDPPMSFANLSDPTTGNNIYENIDDDDDDGGHNHHYTPMDHQPTTHIYNNNNNNNNNYSRAPSVATYSNEVNYPEYANETNEPSRNATAGVHRLGGGHGVRRPHLPPPQPPVVPSTVGSVTVNGIALS